MFSLFRKDSENIEVPNWASFFSDKEYKTFISDVGGFFKKKGIIYTITEGVVHLSNNSLGLDNLGLLNLAQMCKQNPIDNWKRIVVGHFEGLVKSYEFEKKFKENIEDFNYVKLFLGVRLYPIDYITQSIGKDLVVGKDLTEDIFEMLVFDFPQSIANVQPDQLKIWGKSIEELFEIGINNIKSNYSIEISKQKIVDFEIWLADGNHLFVPNIIFDFKNNSNLIGSGGALIGLPHRGAALIYPIENLEIVKAINAIIPIINGMYNEGPGSISNKLYWYKDDLWEDLPYKFENNKLEFFPPENFVKFLNTLEKV